MPTIRPPARLGAPRAPASPQALQGRVSDPDQLPVPVVSRAVLLTPVQAADILSVSARVLERWRGTGKGPQFVCLNRKSIRYRVEDIEAFVTKSLCLSTAPGASLR